MTLLQSRARGGAAVVVVLHDLSLAARFCHRLVLLHEGRVLAEGAPETVLTADTLARAYGIEALIGRHGSEPYVVPWRVVGRRAFIAGHGPQGPDGAIAAPFGKVGRDVTVEQAYASARLTALAVLGSLKRALGDLDRVAAWGRVFGMVNMVGSLGATTAGPVMGYVLGSYDWTGLFLFVGGMYLLTALFWTFVNCTRRLV